LNSPLDKSEIKDYFSTYTILHTARVANFIKKMANSTYQNTDGGQGRAGISLARATTRGVVVYAWVKRGLFEVKRVKTGSKIL
jgi:hypothetical protein